MVIDINDYPIYDKPSSLIQQNNFIKSMFKQILSFKHQFI